jgi:Na+-driven multidrug efflux pump
MQPEGLPYRKKPPRCREVTAMTIKLCSAAKGRLDRQLTSPVFTARQIYRMTLPLILDSLSIMFINMLITALISSAGESSIAAVNLVSPLLGLIMCVLGGISAGGTVAVTQCFGGGDMVKTQQAAGHILWLTFLTGSLLGLVLILFPRPILTALYPQAEPAIMEKAVSYMIQGTFSMIIFTVYSGVFSILRGLGESQKCLCLTIIINVSYLLFSILFLNVLQMDILGSALAQIFARSVGALAALAFLFLPRDMPIRLRLEDVFSFQRPILSTILEVSIPFGLEQLFLAFGGIVLTAMTVPLGTGAVVVNSIAGSLMGVTTAAAGAAGNLGITISGRCIGAGEKEHAFGYGCKMCVLALFLLAASATIAYPFFPTMLTHLYHASPEVQEKTLELLRYILLPIFLFWPFSNVLPAILRSGHDSVFPSVLSLASMWCVRIVCGYFLAYRMGMGLTGLWTAMWVEWAVRSIVLAVHYFRRKWLVRAVPERAV